MRSRRGGGESLRSLARCAAAARNPRSNINRVNALDFTLWQEQWSKFTLELFANTRSHARRSIVSKICVTCVINRGS